jgi:hypothetical protein
MNYTYEILDFVPVDSRARVVVVEVGGFGEEKLFFLASFDPEEVKQQIEDYAPVVFNHWNKADIAPTISPVTGKQSATFEKQKEVLVEDPEPVTDPITEMNVEVVKETEDAIIYTYPVETRPQEDQAAVIRGMRNYELGLTDFHALSDRDMSPEMAEYRQALRDVPQQAGFPQNVEWPTATMEV